MAEVWANVVYTPKSNVNPPLGDSKEVPKTELWEMPDPPNVNPQPKTENWASPVVTQDSVSVTQTSRLEDLVNTYQDDSWIDKILQDLEEPKPAAQPQPESKAESKPAPKAEPKPEPKPIPAEGRTFKTQGDPLVRTGDGLWFGVHEPGKYVSLKSKDGDFLMEQQISKTKDGRKYNTEMGFKLGKNTIAINTNGGNGPNTMTVNGKKYDLKFAAHGIDLPGGGKVTYDPKTSKVHITSADGDKISINRVNNAKGVHYLNAEVELSAKRPAGSVHGLLGSLDADTNANNDTRDRNGNVMAVKGSTTLNMNDAHLWKTPEDFAKEWRTRAKEGVL